MGIKLSVVSKQLKGLHRQWTTITPVLHIALSTASPSTLPWLEKRRITGIEWSTSRAATAEDPVVFQTVDRALPYCEQLSAACLQCPSRQQSPLKCCKSSSAAPPGWVVGGLVQRREPLIHASHRSAGRHLYRTPAHLHQHHVDAKVGSSNVNTLSSVSNASRGLNAPSSGSSIVGKTPKLSCRWDCLTAERTSDHARLFCITIN